MRTPVSITYFTITLSGANVSTQLLIYKAASLCNSLARSTCLHASSSTSCRSKSLAASLDRTAYRLYDPLCEWHKSNAAV